MNVNLKKSSALSYQNCFWFDGSVGIFHLPKMTNQILNDRKVAGVAAGRVQGMRDLLIR